MAQQQRKSSTDNAFIEKYIGGKLLLFVVPSRWFIGGKGLDGFRDFMMGRKDIVFIQHEDDATKWFGNNVDIKGGVNYFLKDALYDGLCLFNGVPYDLSKYDCVIKPKYHKIIDIVINMESISKLYMGRYFGVETNDKRLKLTKKNNKSVSCYVSLFKQENRIMYLDTYAFTDKNSFWNCPLRIFDFPAHSQTCLSALKGKEENNRYLSYRSQRRSRLPVKI